MTGCPMYQRHWYTLRTSVTGATGCRTPVCVRCGAPNPAADNLTTDDWRTVLTFAPDLLDNPESIRDWLDTMEEDAA